MVYHLDGRCAEHTNWWDIANGTYLLSYSVCEVSAPARRTLLRRSAIHSIAFWKWYCAIFKSKIYGPLPRPWPMSMHTMRAHCRINNNYNTKYVYRFECLWLEFNWKPFRLLHLASESADSEDGTFTANERTRKNTKGQNNNERQTHTLTLWDGALESEQGWWWWWSQLGLVYGRSLQSRHVRSQSCKS